MEAEPERNPPLADIKVLDLSRVVAGPCDTRSWGPPSIDREGDRSAAYFYACNRGKASIVLDLTTVEGQAAPQVSTH
jgi:crotonobetainyl-CoA:carnitine CoA-transferase CaiB-like acyl-CoA transferase